MYNVGQLNKTKQEDMTLLYNNVDKYNNVEVQRQETFEDTKTQGLGASEKKNIVFLFFFILDAPSPCVSKG